MNVRPKFVGQVLAVSLLIVAMVSWSHPASLENRKVFEVEEGWIRYEFPGSIQGTEVVEFREWGRKTATRTTFNMTSMGFTQTPDRLTITDGQWNYYVNLRTKKSLRGRTSCIKGLC